MKNMPKTSCRRILALGILGLVILCLGGVGVSMLSNLNLPAHSPVVERLSDLDKARLAEATHLRQTLGEAV
jgi:hypothetical protein